MSEACLEKYSKVTFRKVGGHAVDARTPQIVDRFLSNQRQKESQKPGGLRTAGMK